MTLNNGSASLSTGNLPNAPSNLADARNAPLQHSRSVSDTIFPTNPSNLNSNVGNQPMSPAMIQMQKMMEQQQRLQAGLVAGNQIMGGFSNQNINPAAARQDAPMGYPAAAGPSQPSQPSSSQPTPAPRAIVWQGSLVWSGVAASGKKELQTVVYAATANVAEWYVSFFPRLWSIYIQKHIFIAMLIHGLER